MASRARQSVAPLYLFLCLVLGGSAQAIYGNMLLRLLGLAIIAWAAMSTREGSLLRSGRQLVLITLLGLGVAALQLVPLPPSFWTHLGGRQPIASGYAALGVPIPSFPLSLTPYQSLDAILALIPPLGMFCAMVRLKAYRATWLVAALVAGTFLGILLGALQVASSDPMSSPWYLYAESSFGVATGFFANANHMATLLVIVLPFLAALLAAARRGNVQRYSALLAVVVGAGLVLVVGILLNRSIAGYVLAFPVLAASALIVLRKRSPLRRWAIALAGLFLIGAVGALASSSIRGQSFGLGAATSVQSRQEILSTTGAALRDFLPFGSGLGSFPQVYTLYENHDRVTATYVNHAHNDYAEIALETGVAGIIVMALFLLWWGASVGRVWRSAEAGPYARAASIASAAILVHSLVDFPLRTAAINTCFAMCLALLVRQRPAAAGPSELRPARHVVVG